ncbi:hypothetical protein EYC80_002626 [Monilinia laxa]|uniref:Transmembrane protein n=1 Tax=Monilinia laxa TaxID=61186 RepID=A0A5N6K4I5_MONLA|nr:hypothetical protein EYC80_002626 [Monilinia laxa]
MDVDKKRIVHDYAVGTYGWMGWTGFVGFLHGFSVLVVGRNGQWMGSRHMENDKKVLSLRRCRDRMTGLVWFGFGRVLDVLFGGVYGLKDGVNGVYVCIY